MVVGKARSRGPRPPPPRRSPPAAPVAAAARERGIEVPALSRHYLEAPPKSGLMLGYAGVPEPEMKRGIAGLARVLMLSAAGLVTFELLLDAASLLPAITLGTWIGTRYFRAVSAERFFATLQWMLLLAAALLAVKGVGLLLES